MTSARSAEPVRGRLALLAICVVAQLASFGDLYAQGITSSALQGRVLGADGRPVGDAIVTATSIPSGTQWRVRTDGEGRYFLENVEPGGPYLMEARRIGFLPARLSEIRLALGQRYLANFVLDATVVELGEVTIASDVDARLNAGRSGPEHIVTESELASLPNLARDLRLVTALAPLAVVRPLGGISIGGVNQGYNSLQVDGGVNADLYLGRSPGGASPSGALPEVLPHGISLETVREFQVLAAPFDVRLGNFAGGLLNAVTKSGTNEVQGTAFVFVQNGQLVGGGVSGRRVDFTTWQFGGTVSGPLVRDRVHYFVSADLQARVLPDPGPLVTDPGRTGVSEASASRFQQILKDSYGLDAGSIASTGRLRARDWFAKLTAQLGSAGRLELSHHHAHAARQGFIDVGRTFDSTALSSVSGVSRSVARTSRLIWGAVLGNGLQPELIVSHQRLHDDCRPEAHFPLIQVRADAGTLLAGPNSVCPTTDVRQSALELTGNLTAGVGPHVLTMGTRVARLHFEDPLVQVSAGRWDFSSLDSLAQGLAAHYDRGLPAPPPHTPGADFRVLELGGYAQDRWTVTSQLTVTVGMRVDVPFLPDAAVTNPALVSRGIDTGRMPSGIRAWSPRLGFNYDLHGDRIAFLRGGAGLFAGAVPYRWLGNGYRDSGNEILVSCDSPRVPAFSPGSQPAACSSPGGTSRRISYFSPQFRFPQNLKLALGADRLLPGGIVATIDILYTRAINQIFITQANLAAPSLSAEGEGGRLLYGTIDPASGRTSPRWRDTTSQTREIYRLSNASGDRALSLSAQVRRRFGRRAEVQASYAYSRVRDRLSVVNFPARANFSNTPLDGTIEDRNLRPSFFETPHKVSVAASIGAPQNTQLTLLYQGASQPPYTYVVNGDANADGIGGPGSLKNDVLYVPLDASDVTLTDPADYARLDAFIDKQRCLREQRGRLMRRGSCRNAWLDVVNARLMTTLSGAAAGRRLEVSADAFNVPNLINPRWGRQRDVTTGPSVTLLALQGWDATNGRGRYRVPPRLPASGVVDDASSRWRVQVGVRYYME